MVYEGTEIITEAMAKIPKFDKILKSAFDDIVPKSKLSPEYLMENFGSVLKEIENNAHNKYNEYEEAAISHFKNPIIDSHFSENKKIDNAIKQAREFEFRMSQSRKSRAGKTFEKAISCLLEIIEIPHEHPKMKERSREFDNADFIVPSVKIATERPEFYVLLSIKRTTRERWKLVISERNLNHVYLIIHDSNDITEENIKKIKDNKIILYIYEEDKLNEKFISEKYVRSLNNLPNDLKYYCK